MSYHLGETSPETSRSDTLSEEVEDAFTPLQQEVIPGVPLWLVGTFLTVGLMMVVYARTGSVIVKWPETWMFGERGWPYPKRRLRK